jgi:hypothetical protein
MRKSLYFTCFICALLGALGMFLTMSFFVAPAQAQTEDLADLTVEEDMIRLQDIIFPGNTGIYRATVRNIGTKTARDVKVTMRFNFQDVCFHTVTLEPGQANNIWCGYGASLVGDLHAEVIIDTSKSVRESNEDNNEGYHRFQVNSVLERTDIEVTAPIKTQIPELHMGDDVDFSVVLKNKANYPTGRFASSWYVDDEKEPICTVPVQLQANETMDVSCVALDIAYLGPIRLRYVADEYDYVVELDENNNEAVKEFTILPKRDVPVEYKEEPKPAEEPATDPASESTGGEVLGVTDTPPTFEALAQSLVNGLSVVRDQNLEASFREKYLSQILDGMPVVGDNAQRAIMDFITYGVDTNSMKLGAGERAAVIFSYKQAFNKLPLIELELADVIRIANGRWPVEQNLAAQDESHKIFYKIYGHVADMGNPHENAAITIMTYGLKQQAQNRNLESEKAGIKTFKYFFGHAPQTTQDWNVMQAITYSGASR